MTVKISIPSLPFMLITAVAAALLTSQAVAAPPLSGAIFTTNADGTIVNANTQYASKCDVYLDGGPGPNAPAGAAGLPAGDYYFQVTDPSGKKLLSTDPVSNRRFTVSSDGVIVAYTGSGGPPHPTGVDQDHAGLGAITIRLANTTCPADFLDTPNNGGVYKAWVTPVADLVGDPSRVDNDCGNGCFHGFKPAASKTDNFKVKARTATFCLTIYKGIVTKSAWLVGPNWKMMLTDGLGVTNIYYTDANGQARVCNLLAGPYTVEEDVSSGYTIYELRLNGKPLPQDSVISFTWSPGKPEPVIDFFNKEPK